MTRKYKAIFPFSNGDYYVVILDGQKFTNWLKNKQVPEDLRRLTIPGGHGDESVRCITRAKVFELIKEMALRESINQSAKGKI